MLFRSQLFVRDVNVVMEAARAILDSKTAKLPEKQAVVAFLKDRKDEASAKLIRDLAGRLAARKLDAGLKLDVYLLARDSADPALAPSLRSYLASGSKTSLRLASPDLPYDVLTDGGDATRGREIVNGHLAANCTA